MAKCGDAINIYSYQLPLGGIVGRKYKNEYYYFLIIVEDVSRTCWVEFMEDKKALTLMFGTLRALQALQAHYDINPKYMKTGVASEFNAGKFAKDRKENPFERLLVEMKIKHMYQRPSATAINEKMISFVTAFKEEYLKDIPFESVADLKEKLLDYVIYYNERRPNAILDGMTPREFAKKMAVEEEVAKDEK